MRFVLGVVSETRIFESVTFGTITIRNPFSGTLFYVVFPKKSVLEVYVECLWSI